MADVMVARWRQYFRDHLYREFLDVSCHKTFAYADANERDNVSFCYAIDAIIVQLN